jgi:hypothetical protein
MSFDIREMVTETVNLYIGAEFFRQVETQVGRIRLFFPVKRLDGSTVALEFERDGDSVDFYLHSLVYRA